jgi:hypothetical protein
VGIAAALCLLIIVVRVQQYVFQFRAERLENDMKSLKYGSTTLAQAQPIFRRWNATYDDGPCESAKCSGEITIGDFAYAHAEFFSRHQRLFRAYGVLGGRPAFLRAGASILDGVVRSKSYSLDVEVFPSEAVGFTPLGYSLVGATRTMENLPARYVVDPRHPSYRVGWPSGCEVCIMIYVDFTSAASPADVERVSKFDFSCVTRWAHPCRLKVDIMPAAWQDVHREHPEMSPY